MRISLTKKLIIISLVLCLALTEIISLSGFLGISTLKAFAEESTSPEEQPVDDSDIDHFFYNQLTSEQQEFYKAMEDMLKSGKFIAGEDYDLVANKRVSQAQLEDYANGDQSILKVLGAARDAFYTDYDDVFYVDFSYLSLRVTQSSDGKYHAYLGSGRSDSYYVEGFASEQDVKNAMTQYKAKLNDVVNNAKAATPTEDQVAALGDKLAAQVAKIQEAHKQIALATVYKLESTCTPGNEGHIRTPYGVFIKGEALCEGYSRAFKAVMDELGYPCVLINGGYRHSQNQVEEHMWTYVKLVDDNWYAVDQTFDDLNGKVMQYGLNQVLAEYTENYFLKGAAFMESHHVPSEYKSASEHPFRYPTLCEHNLGAEVTNAYGYFYIEQEPYTAAMKSTSIKVSVWIDGVGWCGYDKAKENGYYILMRHEGNYLPDKLNNNQYVGSDGQTSKDLVLDLEDEDDNAAGYYNSYLVWMYVNPVPGATAIHDEYNSDGSSYTLIPDESKASGFEFAVTTVPPLVDYNEEEKGKYDDPDMIYQMFVYSGDMSALTARSGFIATKYAADVDYQPAPSIVRSTPVVTGQLRVGNTYHVKVEYDQVLKLEDGYEKIVASVYGVRATGEILKGTNTVPGNVISNIDWYAGKRNASGFGMEELSYITFDFTPSKLFAHDNILYMFNFNLVGELTGKRVNTVSYCVANKTSYCSLGVYGYNWNIFGQPQLIEDSDLSRNGWVDSNGNSITNVKDRISLVVTSPSSKQDKTMNDMIADDLNMSQQKKDEDGNYTGEFNEEAFQSFTYNIQLTLCKACIVKTGEGLRISIGFPEGFDYQAWMNGVTFKMYHFIYDKQDNITGVEEIPVTVTPLGLIIVVKSFSPFALVAVKGDEPVAPTQDKTVIVSNSIGGTAYAEVFGEKESRNLFKLQPGETRKLTVKANDGYIIESVSIGSKIIMSNAKEITLDLDFDTLSAQSIISVNFVAETVKAAEEQRGESAVIQGSQDADIQEFKKATITVSTTEVSVKVGEKIKLEAQVTTYGEENIHTYQWYKDGVAIEGATGKTLTIQKAELSDSGKYTLKVTTTSGSSHVISESDVIDVNVTEYTGLTTQQIVILIIVAAGLALLFIVLTVASIAVSRSRRNK